MVNDADEDLFELRDAPLEIFERARETWLPRLEAALPFAEVMEIGSTAAAGLIGKQDMDFLARVRREDFARARETLETVLERHGRKKSSEALQIYRLPSEDLDIALRLTVVGGPQDQFHLFIEALRADAKLRAAYNRLKKQWNGKAMRDYRTAKSAFVSRALTRKSGR